MAMNKKTAQKWQKIKKDKEEVNDSTTAISFKTHKVSESEAEILVPLRYPQYVKNQQILLIECGREKLLVQVATPNNYAQQRTVEEKSEISVLRSILDLHGIQCGPTGMFKGNICILNQSKIPQYNLEIVEFLIKQTYFSRRDQYKVMKALKDSVTHVYLKKTLYFDQIAIEVNAMMRNNQTMVKTGIIDKNTKLIFRTNCSKLTVGIELSIETFELNEHKELYLEKMIEFLYVYLHRNTHFNNTHRLTLIFFGRCYYPQFKTLKAAYDYLLKENTTIADRDKFQINFSVALQKDYRGRIFQDVYRRIIWSSDMIDNFRQYIWEKISEFIFTINWDFSDNMNSIGKFITKSLEDKIEQRTIEDKIMAGEDKNNLRIKPFIHKIKSKLAASRDTNIFEAISLISEQYRHHYKFRSLTETGNTILILSAGSSTYQVDELSYKMAKSYIYLTNISCSLINFAKKKDSPLRAQIISCQKKPLYKGSDCAKLENISLNCIEKQIYISPMNEDMIIWDFFQSKNYIFPDELQEADSARHKQLKEQHHCSIQKHYELVESPPSPGGIQVKDKDVSFIKVCAMDDRCLYIHEILYDKLKIPRLNTHLGNSTKFKISEMDIFSADLDKIIINKKDWNFEGEQNQIGKKMNTFRLIFDKNDKSDSKISKEDKASTVQRISRSIFKACNELPEQLPHEPLFETTSNDEFKISHEELPWIESKRKNSDYYQSQSIEIGVEQEQRGKINIFEQTYRNKNHQYNAGQKNANRTKKFISHNKQRCKNNFLQSNIHYFVPYYSEPILKRFKAFIKKQYIEELKDEEQKIIMLFEMQKQWKNLCFPQLTPIYTKYQQNFVEPQENLDAGVIDESNDKRISILQDQICKLLMKNYQIQEISSQYSMHNIITKLSKGHVSCHLKMNGNNLARSYIIDLRKQRKIVPFMLYRYLCYQDKDCRFCAKYVYLQDKNYYDHTKKHQLETKTVKIVLACENTSTNIIKDSFNSFSGSLEFNRRRDSQNNLASSFAINKRDPFQEFIRMFNDKYKEFSIELATIQPKQQPKKKKVTLNFSKDKARALFHHEEVEIQINTEYNTRSLFQILVSWNLCSSVIVSELVENVMTLGRRSKLKPFLVTAGNIFNTIWSITTIGQIIFEHNLSLQLLQASLLKAGKWLWDSNDYFLHISGISFIQFKKEKKLILWRDNNNEKRNRDIKKDDSCKQYNEFFMRAAAIDFIGGIIIKVIEEAEKSSKTTFKLII